ncbi:MAG: RNA-binding protein [Verrucomicrobiota bacterium]
MNTKIYVGNFPFESTEDELRELFSQYGAVMEVAIIMDRETGRPRGFGFVTMADREGMDAAVNNLDGQEWNGRSLKVNEARPREDRGGGGGGGGGRGGDRRGGGRDRRGGGRDRRGGGHDMDHY